MTDDEINLVNLIGVVFNRFDDLPILHSGDRSEFIFHVHALQNIVMARVAIRAMRNAGKNVEKIS